MDNAMLKRGIGAVVLAIIAALLLGYLLKDKSREREEAVEMKLPGAPELTIPSLTEAVGDTASDVKEGAVSLVENTKETVKDAGNSVVASASGAMNTISDTASNAVEKTTNAAKSMVSNDSQAVTNNANPGFSFRPPSQNEEKEITDKTNNSASGNNTTTVDNTKPQQTKETVVASSNTNTPTVEEKPFKPVIEEKPPAKKVVKKPVTEPAKPKPAAKPKTAEKPVVASSGKGKYSIQLLATSSQSRANKLAETMNSEGYLAFITQTQRDNKILYRVRVGGHNDRSAAIKAQEGMKRRYQKNFFVQNSLVVSN